jgi:serine/threonine-protein kinase RsbW
MFKVQQFDAPARHNSINLICKFVVGVAKQNGLTGDSLFHVELAVDEACTNIVEHAYEGKSGRIYITCGTELLDGQSFFVVRLRDNGKPFNPGKVPPPCCESNGELQVGGLGVHFMRKIMDRISFDFSMGWNNLYMYKKIGPQKA